MLVLNVYRYHVMGIFLKLILKPSDVVLHDFASNALKSLSKNVEFTKCFFFVIWSCLTYMHMSAIKTVIPFKVTELDVGQNVLATISIHRSLNKDISSERIRRQRFAQKKLHSLSI
ncbi:hypothetical protein PHYBLDRAFT_175638 [Phycomyces blakesleeanus NRRL 1555(-)]|uniref:Uncharacterized protein n=1 Tax=Phycomyces blakesleeanus (strain ATCC 8743b / DSM 1359 / FGSC 10004 / NBRC 33097 / NRRL 1555) TaxID=763407 RepID=A0A162WAJ6_PHYB8|nr:hypothetical protein PHYBLDRAFT_175638 [Phycomyces blakesleeanus NRRL 1555(-)]OAD65895.1 hypothetical protein PHYBLDRAFT_175638 [Phycomyces blakesleeanus NRRL 1555(-)]|eukprot:XP_018283935.1 hypothetical protein PHYBLDRAFT_175638 [Phycomyces blakesleeanus NRRL 1555(-)]